MQKVNRKEALALGLKKYFTGTPCKRGHIVERSIRGLCALCQKENNNSRPKKKRKPNKYRVSSKKEYASLYNKEWYKNNKNYCSEVNRKYRDKNKALISSQMRKWKQDNKKRHCELNRAAHMRRRTRLKNSEVTKIRTNFILELLESQSNKCKGCSIDVSKKYHIDHIMPVALGGDNRETNLQILCPQCNVRKNAKHPDVWLKDICHKGE